MQPHPRTGRTAAASDRGSVTVFTVLIAAVVLIMTGLAVDVSGQIHAMQEARSVAREAARAGAQQVQAGPAMRGVGAVSDTAGAVPAANAYLAAAGVSGAAALTGATTVRVEVTATYQTRFLGVIGVGSLSANGSGEARITRSLEGVEQ